MLDKFQNFNLYLSAFGMGPGSFVTEKNFHFGPEMKIQNLKNAHSMEKALGETPTPDTISKKLIGKATHQILFLDNVIINLPSTIYQQSMTCVVRKSTALI